MTRLLDVMNDWIGLDVLKAVHMAQGRRGLENEKKMITRTSHHWPLQCVGLWDLIIMMITAT